MKIFLNLFAFCLIFLSGFSFSQENLSYWAVNESSKVFLDGLPQENNAVWSKKDNTISLKTAKGEYRGFQVIIKSGENEINSVELTADDLISGSNVIKQSNFEFFKELYIDKFPDPLVPFKAKTDGAPFDVRRTRLQGVWIDLFVPLETRGGLYKGKINIYYKGRKKGKDLDTKKLKNFRKTEEEIAQGIPLGEKEKIEINLTVLVWDFQIPAKRHLKSWAPYYASSVYSQEKWGSSIKDRKMRWEGEKEYIILAHKHRIDLCPEPFETVKVKWDAKKGKIESIDWSDFDFYVSDLLKGTAFPDKEPLALWQSPLYDAFPAPSRFKAQRALCKPHSNEVVNSGKFSQEYKNAVADFSKEIAGHFESKGWIDKIFVYLYDNSHVYDEPIGPMYEAVRIMHDAIHKGSPKHKITLFGCPDYASISSWFLVKPEYGKLDGRGGYGDYVDIWVPPAGFWVSDWSKFGKTPKSMIKLGLRNGGKESWMYQGSEPCVADSYVYSKGPGYRFGPWASWKYGVDGVCIYVANEWKSNPYMDSKEASCNILYPGQPKGINGAVGSIKMKQWRRGMLDYEYFYLLDKKMKGKADEYVKKILWGSQLGYKFLVGGNKIEWDNNNENWDKVIDEIGGLIQKSNKQ
ncbi:MAG: glycoside hydrolase domain-containing protein [Candidatus Firestonebacteria bacterium]